MLVNAERLIDVNGISCRAIDSQALKSGVPSEIDAPADHARIAFVTPQSIARMGRDSSDLKEGAQKIKVNYGDMVMSIDGSDGRVVGRHLPCGRDAGVYIQTSVGGVEKSLPFTGKSMHYAASDLARKIDEGEELDDDERRISDAIDEVFAIIRARPDPDRFSSEIIGQAFLASFRNATPGATIVAPEDIAAFGRSARHVILHHAMKSVGGKGSDLLSVKGTLKENISRIESRSQAAGIREFFSKRRGGAEPIPSDQVPREILGKITSTPFSRIEAFRMSAATGAEYISAISGNRISGVWLDHLSKSWLKTSDLLSSRLHVCDGMDILTLSDGGEVDVFAWPSTDRVMTVRSGKYAYPAISSQEAPSEKYLATLSRSLEDLRAPRPMVSNMGAA